MQITTNALNVLQHTLGLRSNSRKPYRNHFVASAGHHDMPALEELVREGLMRRDRTPEFCDKRDVVFSATDDGKRYAVEHLPEEPAPEKRTKYDEYLSYGAGSFAEHLGIRKPVYETRGGWKDREYRMFRTAREDLYDSWHESWREVQGEWMPTKKAARASYKDALKAHRESAKGRE